MNVVATPLWGVCIFGAARSGRHTAPWLQRCRFIRQLKLCELCRGKRHKFAFVQNDALGSPQQLPPLSC